MLEINCPFCKKKAYSDVIDKKEDINGQWECENGHKFVLEYIDHSV